MGALEEQTSELGPPAEGKEVGAGVSGTSKGKAGRCMEHRSPSSSRGWRHHRASCGNTRAREGLTEVGVVHGVGNSLLLQTAAEP